MMQMMLIWMLATLPPLPTLQRWFREGKTDSVYAALQADTGRPASRLVYRMVLQMMLVYRQDDSLEVYLSRFRQRLRCPTCFAPLAFEVARRRGDETTAFREAWIASGQGRKTSLLLRYLNMLPGFRDPSTRVRRLADWVAEDPPARLPGVLAVLEAMGEAREALRLILRYDPTGPHLRRLLMRNPWLADAPPPAGLPKETLVGLAWRVRHGVVPMARLWERFPPENLSPADRAFLLRFLPPDVRWSRRLVQGVEADRLPADVRGAYLLHAIAAGGMAREGACRQVGDSLNVQVLWACAEALRKDGADLADTLYARLIRRAPTSSLALQALWRLEETRDTVLPSPPFVLDTPCAHPFCRMVRWWRLAPGRKPPESVRREMEQWILDHPDDPLTPLVRAWWEGGIPERPPLSELDRVRGEERR